MYIELLDVFIVLVPFMILNIYLTFRGTFSHHFFNSRFPFVLISYSVLVCTPVILLLVAFNIHIDNITVFHFYGFQSDVITDILSFEVDFISLLVILWCFSLIYSTFLVSQFALRLLYKQLIQFEVYDSDPTVNLSEKALSLIKSKNIHLKIISEPRFGRIFSLTFFTWFKRNNIIYINDELYSSYTANELNAAVMHEIGHITNLDTIFFPIFNTLNKLIFFDPILKKLNNKYKSRMEFKADLFALSNINNPKHLAKALAKSLEYNFSTINIIQDNNHTSFILSLKGPSKSQVIERIKLILKETN